MSAVGWLVRQPGPPARADTGNPPRLRSETFLHTALYYCTGHRLPAYAGWDGCGGGQNCHRPAAAPSRGP